MVRLPLALGILLCASALAQAQGIDANSGGRIDVNNNGRIDINSGSLTVNSGGTVAVGLLGRLNAATDVTVASGGTVTIGVSGRVDATGGNIGITGTITLDTGSQLRAIAGNVTINAGGVLESPGTNQGSVYLAGNWSNSGTFTPGQGTVIFDGTGAQTMNKTGANATETFYNLTVSKTAGTFTTFDSGAGDDGDRLNVTNIFSLSSAGTFDADPDVVQIEHTFVTFNQSGTSVLKIDTTGDTSNLTAHLNVTGNMTVSGGTFTSADTTSPTMEINVGGNFQVSPVAWQYSGWLRMRGPPDDAGVTTRTIDVRPVSSAVRVVNIWLQDDEDQILIGGAWSQVNCEYVTITRGELRVGVGRTVNVLDYAYTGFTTTDSSAGALGRIRFDGNASATQRRFVLDGGTINAYELGDSATGGNDGYFEITLNGGTLDLNKSPGGFKGGVSFQNSDDAGNASSSLLLRAGTIRLESDWTVTDSEPGASLLFSATGGTIQFDGSGSQSISHVPEAESIGGQGVAMYHLTIANTAVSDSTAFVSLAQDLSAKGILTVSDGRLKVPGKTLTLTGASTHVVSSGAKLDLEPTGVDKAVVQFVHGATLNMDGSLEMLRASGAIASSFFEVSGADGTGYTLNLQANSTWTARYYAITDLGDAGIVVSNGATILGWHDGTLTKETGRTGPCLDLSAVDGTNRAKIPYTLNSVTFDGTSGENVKAGVNTPVVVALGNTASNGPRWGESYDTDPHENEGGIVSQGRMRWESSAVFNVNQALYYDTPQQAVDGSAAGQRIVPMKAIAFDGTVDLAVGGGKDVILDKFLFAPRAGYAVSNSDNTQRGTLRNCVVASGSGVDRVTLVNCTLFDPSGSAPAATNSTLTNVIYEAASDLTGSTTSFCASGVAADFVNATMLDFHLVTGASHIDAGTTPVGFTDDIDSTTRSGTWDRGADEYYAIGVQRLNVDTGYVSRFHWIGGTRGSSSAANGFAYLTSQGGSSTSANNNTLYVVNLSTMAVVTQTQAVGPIVSMAFWVDVSNSGASWRAWVYLVVDTDNDGYGDAIQLVVDRGDSGLVHPNQALGDPDPYDRRFGSVDVYGDGSRYVYRPGAEGEYRMRWVTLSTVVSDGADDAPAVVYNSPSGTNKGRWNRMFVTAYKTTASTGGALLKINCDPYDTNSASAPDNQAFGETMWSILPGDASWYDFDYRGTTTFTWASGFQEIFIPVSGNAAPAQTVLVRYSMAGTSAPAASRNWQATEEAAPVDENRFGATLDSGNTNASCVYAMSDGTVIYNRNVDSASGSSGLRWASRLKNGAGTPQTPVLGPQRFFPNAFALVAYDGGVNKIWDVGGSDARNGCLASSGLKLDLSTGPGLDEIAVGSTQDLDWPMTCAGKPIQKIWVRGTKIYFGTDAGAVYGRNWNSTGSSTATGDETTISGYPYGIAGARITWIFVHPTAGVLIGTDIGGLYRFNP